MPLVVASHTTWRPIAAASDHPLAKLAHREVGQGVSLVAQSGPRNRAGAERFRLFLESNELGRTTLPVVAGVLDFDLDRGAPWIEVTSYRARLALDDGREVDVPEGIAFQVVEALAESVPPGGSLTLEYESPAGAVTARALAAGVPPVATPLGGMLFAAGCGATFRNWSAAGGGRGGRRRLQGFRAINDDRAHERGLAMLGDLEAFMGRSRDLDWYVQSETRTIAEATITALRAQLALPEGPLPPR